MACARKQAARVAAAYLAALALSGCASLVVLPEPQPFPGVPPERDLRADYRAAACARLADAEACERVLLREAGEAPAVPASPPSEDWPQRFRIGLAPGLFAQCLAPVARAFGDVEPGLRSRGFDVTYLDVPGRGTAAANASVIAGRLQAAGDEVRPWILVSYSKGLTDVLEYLVRFPEDATRVAAVVSVAGAANGSPLADAYQSAYRDWLAAAPLPGCSRSDGTEILDLRRDVRRDWWARHGADIRVPVFSLVTTPRPDRVSFGLQSAHAKLGEIDPRNDGKVLWYDQLVPGAYLLGFLNADHWAVATPLDENLPLLAFLFRDNLPRLALVEGALAVVAGVLAGDIPASATPPSR